VEKLVAVLEIQIQRSLGNARFVGDVLHRDRGALAGDGAERSFGDGLDAEAFKDHLSSF
jgi:hypothetical protein